jgi:hypothetical protein
LVALARLLTVTLTRLLTVRLSVPLTRLLSVPLTRLLSVTLTRLLTVRLSVPLTRLLSVARIGGRLTGLLPRSWGVRIWVLTHGNLTSCMHWLQSGLYGREVTK